MPRNEADTRALLIEPKLKSAGWSDRLVTREHFYRRDHRYTDHLLENGNDNTLRS